MCGPRLEALLTTSDVRRRHSARFPYRGYGFAWAGLALLTLRLAGQHDALPDSSLQFERNASRALAWPSFG